MNYLIDVDCGSFWLGDSLDSFLVPVGVRLSVKLAKFLQFSNFLNERGLCSNHRDLGFSGHNLSLFNSLFGLFDLVELLLLVSELLAFGVEENVVNSRKVDDELTLLLGDGGGGGGGC